MNTLQRIQAIQKHFDETPKDQILRNMQKAGFDVESDLSINEQLKVAVKRDHFRQPIIYKVPMEEQVWSTKGIGVGS